MSTQEGKDAPPEGADKERREEPGQARRIAELTARSENSVLGAKKCYSICYRGALLLIRTVKKEKIKGRLPES